MGYYRAFDGLYGPSMHPARGEDGKGFRLYDREELRFVGIEQLPLNKKPKTNAHKKHNCAPVRFHFDNVSRDDKTGEVLSSRPVAPMSLKQLKKRIDHYRKVGKDTSELERAKRQANRDYLHCRAA